MIKGMKLGIGFLLGLGVMGLAGMLLFGIGGAALLSWWAMPAIPPQPPYQPPPPVAEIHEELITWQEASDVRRTQEAMANGPTPWKLTNLNNLGLTSDDPVWPHGTFASLQACQEALHTGTAWLIRDARQAATRLSGYQVSVHETPNLVSITTRQGVFPGKLEHAIDKIMAGIGTTFNSGVCHLIEEPRT